MALVNYYGNTKTGVMVKSLPIYPLYKGHTNLPEFTYPTRLHPDTHPYEQIGVLASYISIAYSVWSGHSLVWGYDGVTLCMVSCKSRIMVQWQWHFNSGEWSLPVRMAPGSDRYLELLRSFKMPMDQILL